MYALSVVIRDKLDSNIKYIYIYVHGQNIIWDSGSVSATHHGLCKGQGII